ncbi:MlaD family protein [Candidatus Margulisiibacteriota bacterium]
MALSSTTKVGILTIIASIALGAIIIWKTDILTIGQGYELLGSFESVEGLTIGSEVRYRGLKVGKVMAINPGPLEIKINALIDRSIKFPADSQLRVSYDGIVGQKFLEVKPGTSEVVYVPPQVVYGIKTSGIVDFIDIGSENLVETKLILENVRRIIENRRFQSAFLNIGPEIEQLTLELRETNQGIRNVVADPEFQANVKGTMSETKKTLASANKFFESAGKVNMRATGVMDIGTTANAVQGNVDIIQSEKNYFRLGMGEGPTRQLSLLDVLFTSKVTNDFGFRIGVINNQLGGGVAIYPSDKVTYRGDVYDINNPRPNWPKIRLGYEYMIRDYMDMVIKGDDLLNSGSSNVTLGIQVRPVGERVY